MIEPLSKSFPGRERLFLELFFNKQFVFWITYGSDLYQGQKYNIF